MEPMNIQLSSMLILFLTGMIGGFFFDLYRVFRSQLTGKKRHRQGFINMIGDGCFWCLLLILITPLIFWGTWLELRLYVWLLLLGGIILYFGIFSALMIPLLRNFWRMIFWLPRKLSLIFWWLRIWIKKIVWWFSTRISHSN